MICSSTDFYSWFDKEEHLQPELTSSTEGDEESVKLPSSPTTNKDGLKQANDIFSLQNLTTEDAKRVKKLWKGIKDLETLSRMFHSILQQASPATESRLKQDEDSTAKNEIRFLVKCLKEMCLRLENKQYVLYVLNEIAGPSGYFKTPLTLDDIEALVITSLQAVEKYCGKPSPEALDSLENAMTILFALIQDLTKWDEVSDIYP